MGRITNDLILALPQTQATKSYAQSLRDWPLWTAVRGLPSSIPADQRDFLSRLGAIGIRSKLHSASMPSSWSDVAKSVYSPAMPATASMFQKALQYLVPPPSPEDYIGLVGSGYRMLKPEG